MNTITGVQNRDIPLKEFCDELSISAHKLPTHIAIIMDGNGRWAQLQGKKRTEGHVAGVKSLRKAIKACLELDIRYLSVYTFSTENWKRPKDEVDFLMSLIQSISENELPNLLKNGVRVKCLGDWTPFSDELNESFKSTETQSKDGTNLQLNLMINYGGRQEILHAMKSCQILTEEEFESNLYTAGIPDPDILIRTGGDFRLSNFLLWQLSYTELFFIEDLWPDFNEDALQKVIRSYQKRDRRYGGL